MPSNSPNYSMPRPETLQKLALENENDAQVCQYC
jgi:hypothetical protein